MQKARTTIKYKIYLLHSFDDISFILVIAMIVSIFIDH